METETAHDLHVKITDRFYRILFDTTMKVNAGTVSQFVRKTLAEKCKQILNGDSLAESILEDLEFLENVEKEK